MPVVDRAQMMLNSKPKPRHGSFMSTKQLVSHARAGNAFIFSTGDDTLLGWLVGMDDYHYLVVAHDALSMAVSERGATGDDFQSDVTALVLVHKSAPVVVFSDINISQVTDVVQDRVARIGDPFLSYWEQQYDQQPTPDQTSSDAQGAQS
jgi:hypothetical protein